MDNERRKGRAVRGDQEAPFAQPSNPAFTMTASRDICINTQYNFIGNNVVRVVASHRPNHTNFHTSNPDSSNSTMDSSSEEPKPSPSSPQAWNNSTPLPKEPIMTMLSGFDIGRTTDEPEKLRYRERLNKASKTAGIEERKRKQPTKGLRTTGLLMVEEVSRNKPMIF